ncbi:MAG: threonine ammonia-lyase [Promethearchaeota archaeon]
MIEKNEYEDLKLIDIIKARNRIQSYIRETPLEFSKYYSKICGGNVFLKLENLQVTNSFKIRGGLNAMLTLTDEEKEKGVVVASSGNHAQGIGFASQLLNVPTTIIVPENTPRTKIEAIRSYGVDLRIQGSIYDDAERIAREIERKEKKKFISAYNDFIVLAGQGTIGIEILNQNPDLEILLAPVGGGGLLSGMSFTVKQINPEIQVYGVQSEASSPMHASFKEGKIVDIPMRESIAEGLHGSIEKNSITFPYILKYCADILLVSEQEIKDAIITFLKYHHQICEGAGAVGLAALKRYSSLFKGKNIGVIISGGNLDFSDLLKMIKE